MMPTTLDAIRELVEPISKGFCAIADNAEFMPDDYAGGNIDDSHTRGFEDGRVSLAREIMKLLDS
jgi:hypothetical protein